MCFPTLEHLHTSPPFDMPSHQFIIFKPPFKGCLLCETIFPLPKTNNSNSPMYLFPALFLFPKIATTLLDVNIANSSTKRLLSTVPEPSAPLITLLVTFHNKSDNDPRTWALLRTSFSRCGKKASQKGFHIHTTST